MSATILPIENETQLIQAALCCLEKKLKYKVTSSEYHAPAEVRQYLRLQLEAELNEVFAVMFLDSQLRLIAFEKLFQGTVDNAMVHPRVVVQKALAYNASRVILVHNHPSGKCVPSEADKAVTERLQSVLREIDIEVCDHFIVAEQAVFSFSERGLL